MQLGKKEEIKENSSLAIVSHGRVHIAVLQCQLSLVLGTLKTHALGNLSALSEGLATTYCSRVG